MEEKKRKRAPGGGRPKGSKNKVKRPPKEKLPLPKKIVKATKESLLKAKEELLRGMEALKADNPFWFFEPSDGVIDKERYDFLRGYIKEEDIPAKLDGQLDVLLSDALLLAAFGGNQSGKSTIGAVRTFIKTTGELPLALVGKYPEAKLRKDFSRTLKVRIVGVDHKTMLNTLIPTYQKWCPREYLKNGKWSDSFSATQNTLFIYKHGYSHPIASFEFMTNQQDVSSFQGPPIDILVYDEEPRLSIHKENLMRFTTAERMDTMFCMTPTNGITWVADLFDGDDVAEGVEGYKLTSVSNKKANLESLKVAIEGMDSYEEKKMRLLGDFVSLSGLVYGKLFDKRVHVIEPFFEDLNPYEKKQYLCLTGSDPHLVTPTAMVFVLLDREGNVYVDRCWHKEGDTEEIKAAWWDIVKGAGYRYGWSVADKSSNSSIMAFGGRNIYMELSRGKGAIPALRTSEKFEGSIKAGVDEIKRRLKFEEGGKPSFFVVDRPENKALINSFRTLERDTYANEDVNGPKDRIKEGKHHLHAAMRYIFQFPLNWYEAVDNVPQPVYTDEAVCW